jgi:hypothetical protein
MRNAAAAAIGPNTIAASEIAVKTRNAAPTPPGPAVALTAEIPKINVGM